MSATYLLAHVSLPAATSTENEDGAGTASTSNSKLESGHSDSIWCTAYTIDTQGRELVITAGSDHSIKMWDPTNGKRPLRTIRPANLGIVGLAVDPSSGGASFLVASSLDSVISRWSLEGELQGKIELGPAESWGLSLHPTSLNLVTAGEEGKIRVMSSAIDNFGEVICRLEGRGYLIAVCYSSDAKYLAAAGESGYVSLFDAQTNTLLCTFPAHSAPIRSVTFTSSLLITGSDDKRINVFDLRALTSTGATGGGSRRGQVASLGGHEGWVVAVAARNDRLLASGSSDGSVKLWDLSNFGSALATLRDASGDCWSLAWRPDSEKQQIEGLGGANSGLGGGQLVSAGADAHIRWWRGSGGVVVT